MEQEEAIGAAVAVLPVERLDAGPRRVEDLGVARQRFGGGIAEIAEDREVDVRIDVAERLHLEVREKLGDLLHAIENRRHDDHRARRSPARDRARAAAAGAAESGTLMSRCTIWMASSLAGTSVSSATTTSAGAAASRARARRRRRAATSSAVPTAIAPR